VSIAIRAVARNWRARAKYIAVGIGVLICVSPAVRAQQNLPGSVQPGQIERRFEQPQPPRSTLETVIPAVPQEQLAPSEAAKIHFVLSGIEVTGSTVYKESDFLPLYKDQLGKDITVADLYKIADAGRVFLWIAFCRVGTMTPEEARAIPHKPHYAKSRHVPEILSAALKGSNYAAVR